MKYESELSNYLNRVILLAPCTAKYEDSEDPNQSKEWMDEVGFLRSIGVHVNYGPTWEQDVVTICD